MNTKLQQPIKWHGGKHYMADWIISMMPPRTGTRSWHLYREPFAGGLSVLLRLDPEGLSEAVNDKHYELTNFWNVIREPQLFKRFQLHVASIPLSESEWKRSGKTIRLDEWGQDVNLAVKFFVRARQSRQGLMRDFATTTRRLRRGMNENVSAWLSAVDGLPDIHERLKRVEVRDLDAVDFIQKYDDPEAVFYCDPPYLHETRSTGGGDYRHEMSDEQHQQLLDTLANIEGRFLLSGYPSEMYDKMARRHNWNRATRDIDNKASSKADKPRQNECLWMNY